MRSLALLAILVACRDQAPAPVAPPAIAIILADPGASPDTIEHDAVLPIERAVAQIAGVTTIESRIAEGHATVLVELARDLETAAHEVSHAIAGRLPRDVVPELHRTRRDDLPVATLALHATSHPVTAVSAFAREEIVPRLRRLAGVGAVESHGLAEQAIVVWPDLDKVTRADLAIRDILVALQTTEVGTPDALGELVVKPSIRLHDVARIELGFERAPGEPRLAIRARYDADRDAVLRAVRTELAQIEPPAGMTVTEIAIEVPPRPTLVATVSGASADELRAIADDYVKRLAAAGVKDVTVDPPPGQPEQIVVPDRARAARLGIPLADLFETVRVAGNARIGYATLDGVRTPIVIKLPPMRLDEAAAQLHLRTVEGALVPLEAVVAIETGTSQPILRIAQRRAIRISIRGDVGAAKRAIRARTLPAGYEVKL